MNICTPVFNEQITLRSWYSPRFSAPLRCEKDGCKMDTDDPDYRGGSRAWPDPF